MWFIPTRNRPEAMKAFIQAVRESGDNPDIAVMIDGDPYDIEWPDEWHIHVSSEHLELQRALNELFKLYPNEKTYGFMVDHTRPRIPGWSKQLEEAAGDWNIALCDDLHNRINPRNGLKRITSATCFGGELIRSLGYIWPDFCVHLYGDDALEEIGHELGIVKNVDVKVHDLQLGEGDTKPDGNHQRMYQGKPYAFDDERNFYEWQANVKPDLMERLDSLIPEDCKGNRPKKITICCVQSNNYLGRGAEYVNILHDMILRNMSPEIQYRFICFTDDSTGINHWIETKPLPEADLQGWWNKLALFKRGVLKEGTQVFFFDLDTLVVSDLTEVMGYDGDLCLLRDFYRPDGLGSGLMSWKPESNYHIWDRWVACEKPLLAGGDQSWIERVAIDCDRWQDACPEKVISYKANCAPYPTKEASIVCFHGEPRPHGCTQKWVQDIWKVGDVSIGE